MWELVQKILSEFRFLFSFLAKLIIFSSLFSTSLQVALLSTAVKQLTSQRDRFGPGDIFTASTQNQAA